MDEEDDKAKSPLGAAQLRLRRVLEKVCFLDLSSHGLTASYPRDSNRQPLVSDSCFSQVEPLDLLKLRRHFQRVERHPVSPLSL